MSDYLNSCLKFAGSKFNTLDKLLPILEEYRQPCFVEPFMGAMNVSLNFRGCDEYYLAESNRDLLSVFKSIGLSKEYLISSLEQLFMIPASKHYYEIRNAFNQTGVDNELTRAVYFIYLNKLGYNGLVRYNLSGELNTPVGDKDSVSPPIEQINNCWRFLNSHNVSFHHQTFEETFEHVNKWNKPTLIYCDSPYVPKTSEFKYTKDGFNQPDHEKLKQCAKESPHTVLLSNHWVDYTKELYSDADEVYTFPVKRTISCKGGDRKPVEECVVVYKGG